MNATNANAPDVNTPDNEDADASYARRIKAAGLESDEELLRADGGVDMDAMRERLTRKITMFLNQWHGCAEPLCLRNRGCMAPDGLCSNVDYGPEDADDPEWPQAKDEIYKMLQEEIERRGGLAALEQEE